MFDWVNLSEDTNTMTDTRRYVVTTKSPSGNRMWRTASGTWGYLRAYAATFTAEEADDLIKTLAPTDGSRAPTPVKELAA